MLQNARSVAHLSFLLTVAAATACASGSPVDTAPEPVEERDADRASDEVLAQIEDASARWASSCPQPSALGPCVRVANAPKRASACGARLLGQVEVVDRDREALQAEEDLLDALAMAEKVDPPEDPAELARWKAELGRARLATIDAALEDYLTLEMPADQQGFAAFFKEKTEQGRVIIDDLSAVKHIGDEAAVVRAALRTAWVSAHFVDELIAAEVPAALTEQGAVDNYCAALREHTAGPSRIAADAATYCGERATDAGYEGPEVEACASLENAWSAEQ